MTKPLDPILQQLFEDPYGGEIIYSVVVDRFHDGNPANNYGAYQPKEGEDKDSAQAILKHGYCPTRPDYYHGGDLEGVIKKLDYIKGLGVTTIWLGPLYVNKAVQGGLTSLEDSAAAYHGYWPLNFEDIDPHFGSKEDFKRLVEKAHEKGLKVMCDFIFNHTADVNKYKAGVKLAYRPEGYEAYIPKGEEHSRSPDILNDLGAYNNRGATNFSKGENGQLGDFPDPEKSIDLDDLNTENDLVRGYLAASHSRWFCSTDADFNIDYARVDTAQHLTQKVFDDLIPCLLDGIWAKSNFQMVGEVFDNDPAYLRSFLNKANFKIRLENQQGKTNLKSLFDFPTASVVTNYVINKGSAQDVAKLITSDDYNTAHSLPQDMTVFVSSHDIGRIGHLIHKNNQTIKPQEAADQVLRSYELLSFLRGVVVFYYGDEQGFVGKDNHAAREDMDGTKTPQYLSNKLIGSTKTPADNHFDRYSNTLYQSFWRLNNLRQTHPALLRGVPILRHVNDKGVIAWSKFHPKDCVEYVVAFNNSDQKQKVSFKTDSVDMLFVQLYGTGKETVTTNADGSMTIELEPGRNVVYKAEKMMNRKGGDQPFEFATTKTLMGDEYISIATTSDRPATPGWAKFTAYISIPGKEERIQYLLGFDTSPTPDSEGDKHGYGLYWNTDDVFQLVKGDNCQVTIEAEYASYYGDNAPQVIKKDFVIDRRTPAITVNYENSNHYDKIFMITDQGTITPVDQLKIIDNQINFAWPTGAQQVTLFLAKNYENSWSFAQPIVLDLKKTIYPYLVSTDTSLSTQLWINDAHQIDGYDNAEFDFGLVPAPIQPATKTDLPPKLYARGGMTGWQAMDKGLLQVKDPSHRHVVIDLDPGTADFKFADGQWSHHTNLGGPIGVGGLAFGGNSTNLKLATSGGRYRFHLFEGTSGNQRFLIPMVTKE